MMPTETKDLLQKIDSLKSAPDQYRPFPEHVVKQAKRLAHYIRRAEGRKLQLWLGEDR